MHEAKNMGELQEKFEAAARKKRQQLKQRERADEMQRMRESQKKNAFTMHEEAALDVSSSRSSEMLAHGSEDRSSRCSTWFGAEEVKAWKVKEYSEQQEAKAAQEARRREEQQDWDAFTYMMNEDGAVAATIIKGSEVLTSGSQGKNIKNPEPQIHEEVEHKILPVPNQNGRPRNMQTMNKVPMETVSAETKLLELIYCNCIAAEVSHGPSEEENVAIEKETDKLVEDNWSDQMPMTSIVKPPTNKRTREGNDSEMQKVSSKRGKNEQDASTENMSSSTQDLQDKSIGGAAAGDEDIQMPHALNENDPPVFSLSLGLQASSNNKGVDQRKKGMSVIDELSGKIRCEFSVDVNEPVFSLASVVPIEDIRVQEASEHIEANELSVGIEPSLHELLPVGDPTLHDFPLVPEELPLTKKSPIWKTFELMKAFQDIPQNPNFKPLEEVNLKVRERDALVLMLNFSNLVDVTAEMKLDDPLSEFEEFLSSLDELELHGFDVRKPRSRLELMKEYRTRLATLKENATVIKETLSKRGKCVTELSEMNKLMKELEEDFTKLIEKRDSIVAMKQESNRMVLKLQEQLNTAELNIQEVEQKFYEETSASW